MFSAPGGLLFLDRCDHHRHPLSLKGRHVLGPAIFLKLNRETQQLLFPLFGEHDGAATEEYGCLDFRAFLQELLRMLELELEVVLVGVRPEADLLDDNLGGVLLHLLGLLPLLVEVFLVVKDLADRRICLRAYLYKIEFKLVRHLQGLGDRVDTRLRDVVTDQTNL